MPRAARNLSSAKTTARYAARPSIGWVVLLVAVHVIGNATIHGHVIHLREGKLYSVPGLAALNRYRHTTIIRYRHAVAVCRIDPDVVVVPARAVCKCDRSRRFAAIDRDRECGCQVVSFVLVVRRHFRAEIVVSTTTHVSVVTHEPPVFAAIIRAPQLATIGFFAVQRDSVAGFDQGIDTAWV